MSKDAIDITVIGLGHVGLVTALGFAEMGWSVTGTDQDRQKMAQICAGQAPFYEPGLQELLQKHLDNRRFVPVDDVGQAIRGASVVFVCVGTPQRENGEADLSQVEGVARTIAQNMNGYKLVVEKSTTPVKTAQWIRRTIERYTRSDHPFDVACNPEFLQEGTAVQDVLKPDRVVLGVESDRARDILTRIYEPLGSPLVITDLNTAELIKHAANAFLSTKISFMNMVADLCEAAGADVTLVAQGIGLDRRIGPAFLRAGIGFGGYCLPKDIRAFINIAEAHGVDVSLLKEVERVNLTRVEQFVQKLRSHMWILREKTIALLGLAFKPGTDDIREAPSLRVIERLLDEGAALSLYDAQAMDAVRRVYPEAPGRIRYASSPYEAAEGAHALLILTEWEEFRDLDLARIRELMEVPIIGDGRNVYDPAAVRALGFEYIR